MTQPIASKQPSPKTPRGVLVVTGGARGIGAAVARLAAVRGYAVCINYMSSAAPAEKLRQEIESRGGVATTLSGDVSNARAVTALFDAASHLGPITALVNNAALPTPRRGRFDDSSPSDLPRLLAVNIASALICSREAVLRMSTKHGGAGGGIVNVSSMSAVLGVGGVDYCATKGAIDAMTVGLAREVAKEGIRVNGVRPGPVQTAFTGDDPTSPERLAVMRDMIPLGRAAEPEEIAYPILWLLSDEASYVTGAILNLSGGR